MRLYMQNFHLPSGICTLSILSATYERLRLLATLIWPAVELQDGGVWDYEMSYHVGNKLKGKLARIQYFVQLQR